MSFIKNGQPMIGVNALHALDTSERFTLAHELGHVILHRPRCWKPAASTSTRASLRRDNLASEGTDDREIEANNFAAELLMPEPLLDGGARRSITSTSKTTRRCRPWPSASTSAPPPCNTASNGPKGRSGSMGFVIYDLETTGLNKRFDQILQFAAVRTDENLAVLERVEFEGRLRPHILPSPGALHFSGARYDDLIDPLRPSYDAMMGSIQETLIRWTPSMFIGFNSVGYDDEVLRQALYEALRPPIFITNMKGNSRGDLLKLARVVGTLRPSVLKCTRDADGHRIFRLAELARANGIDPGRSHTAAADVATTLALCQLIAAEAPDLWSSFLRFSNKAAVLEFIAEHDAFAAFEFAGGRQDVHPVTAIGFKPTDKNVRYCLDLTADLDILQQMTADELLAEVSKREGPVRRLKANASPIVTELWELDAELLGDLTEVDLEALAASVHGDEGFVRRLIAAAIASEPTWPKSSYVEFQIYDDFIQDHDEDVCRCFHAAPWTERPAIIDRFQDPRLKKLARRLIYFERPDLLDAHMREQMDLAVRSRLRGQEPNAPGRTFAATLHEFDALRAEVATIDPSLLSYRAYLQAQLATAA